MRFRVLALLAAVTAAHAQSPVTQDRGITRVYQDLQQLRSRARVMMVTAHPDDEDGGLLTMLARGEGAEVELFTLTRGEGGQNKFGGEVGDELGVIRTLELLEADRFYGVEQRFSPVADFGFSKTPEETFEKWGGHDIALASLVREIRRFRPDVLIARFSGTPRDGHAHHQASAMLTKEAFGASGDPTRFPEQLKVGLTVFQPKRLLMGIAPPDAPGTIKVDTGTYTPLLGMSYSQFALEGLSHQTSQGVGGLRLPPGHRYTYYSVAGGLPVPEHATDVLAGLELANPEATAAVSSAQSAVKPNDTTGAAQALTASRTSADRVVADALATSVEAVVDSGQPPLSPSGFPNAQNTFQVAVPGESFGILVRIVNRSSQPVSLERITFDTVAGVHVVAPEAASAEIAPGDSVERSMRVTLSPNASLTRPYWHRSDTQTENVVQIDDKNHAGLPLPPYPIRVHARLGFAGAHFDTNDEVVQTKIVDPVLGQLSNPLIIGPALSVGLEPASQVMSIAGAKSRTVTVGATSYAKGTSTATVRLEVPQGWHVSPESRTLAFTSEGEHQSCQFDVQPGDSLAEGRYKLAAVAEAAGRKYSEGFRMVGRPDIGHFPFHRPAESRISAVNVKVPSVKVGYVTGAGDEIFSVMRQLGMQVEELSAKDFANADLSRYETIVLGIRAYDVSAEVRASRERLMQFVERGGTVLMLNNQSAAAASLLPFTATGSNDRVSVEEVPVTILQPQNAVFHSPNEITSSDWNGWVQERGINFLKSWDAKITPLLSMHDPGEPATQGGLVEAKYGKGVFLYSGLAFARQLPAGVPGATRLFANLIAAGHEAH